MKAIYKLLRRFLSSDLGKGSLILFILINIFNFLNYIFQFTMARMLGPADYGILGVLMSLVYIYSIPAEAIQGVFSKYTTKFNEEQGKIKTLIMKGLNKSLIYGLIAFVLANIVGYFLANFLDIQFLLIFITNIIIFGILIGAILRGVLQGKKKFNSLGWNMIYDSSFRILVSVSLVIIGWSIFGAIIGVVAGIIFGILLAFFSLRNVMGYSAKNANFDGIKGYSSRFMGAMVAVVLMYSMDILLARRFFSPEIVGSYVVLSMLSKMIFFGTLPIAKALFPVSSEAFAKKENTIKYFYKSILIITILCFIALMAFLILPKLIISILFGSQYVDVAPYLFYIGASLTFISLTNLIIFYGLSIEKFKRFYMLYIFVIIEIIAFSMFHNTLFEYSLAYLISTALMFLGSLIIINLEK